MGLLYNKLAAQGIGGDSMLARLSPQEASFLKMLGGVGTRNPNTGLPQFFNPNEYLRLYSDVANDPYWGQNAQEHWERYGQNEGRSSGDAPEGWNAQAYLNRNSDIANDPYFSQNALTHYLKYGQNEGRGFAPIPLEPTFRGGGGGGIAGGGPTPVEPTWGTIDPVTGKSETDDIGGYYYEELYNDGETETPQWRVKYMNPYGSGYDENVVKVEPIGPNMKRIYFRDGTTEDSEIVTEGFSGSGAWFPKMMAPITKGLTKGIINYAAGVAGGPIGVGLANMGMGLGESSGNWGEALKQGVIGGVGSYVGGAITPGIESGLNVSQPVAQGISSGLVGTGAGLAQGQNWNEALTSGATSGLLGYAGASAGEYLGNAGASEVPVEAGGGGEAPSQSGQWWGEPTPYGGTPPPYGGENIFGNIGEGLTYGGGEASPGMQYYSGSIYGPEGLSSGLQYVNMPYGNPESYIPGRYFNQEEPFYHMRPNFEERNALFPYLGNELEFGPEDPYRHTRPLNWNPENGPFNYNEGWPNQSAFGNLTEGLMFGPGLQQYTPGQLGIFTPGQLGIFTNESWPFTPTVPPSTSSSGTNINWGALTKLIGAALPTATKVLFPTPPPGPITPPPPGPITPPPPGPITPPPGPVPLGAPSGSGSGGGISPDLLSSMFGDQGTGKDSAAKSYYEWLMENSRNKALLDLLLGDMKKNWLNYT